MDQELWPLRRAESAAKGRKWRPGSSLDIGELVRDPHVVKRGAIFQQNHKVAGEINIYRSPWKSALTEKTVRHRWLGEDNDYVFKKLLGMSDSEIARLTEKKVIY